MLQSLYAKNLALIEEIQVEFETGLNILSGETGAGKSIILGCINLALGQRANKDIIRDGATYGFVELNFTIKSEKTKQLLAEEDIYTDEDSLVLSRKILENKSISKINGETVTLAQLKAVSALLIDIHGQHEHQSLLKKKNHEAIVDAYIGDEASLLKEEIKTLYTSFTKTKENLCDLINNREQKERELELLEFEVQEIEEASLKKKEDETLEKEFSFMTHAKTIKESLSLSYELTGEGESNASELISRAIKSLQESERYDNTLRPLLTQLLDIDGLLSDFNREINEYKSTLEFSAEDFIATENRLNEINRLKAKYGDSIEHIYEEKERKKTQIYEIYHTDERIEKLKKEVGKLQLELEEKALKLSALRKEQSKLLENDIETQIKDLNFEDTNFKIEILKMKDVTIQGIDQIEFKISLNPGEPLRPLAEIASGGELSRIMLAVKTVLAKKDEIETLIFDEIDVGISGRTAQKVAEKMALIGRTHQVIAITHLPQITAMADHHYLIEKRANKRKTTTKIHKLNKEGSILELARMTGGTRVTENVIQSAVEMKELAIKKKKSMEE
ncbi:MAG TPA: DNA repair protein RecN [Candidatus Dorea intestinavium]|nr:DNA repair protein RecN [Candidatus Dorea intestinavium]